MMAEPVGDQADRKSQLEDLYEEIIQMPDGTTAWLLPPDNTSLRQPSPLMEVPQMAIGSASEDVLRMFEEG